MLIDVRFNDRQCLGVLFDDLAKHGKNVTCVILIAPTEAPQEPRMAHDHVNGASKETDLLPVVRVKASDNTRAQLDQSIA